MRDQIIGGTLLILLLAALRPLVRGRVRPGLAYGLWLLAAARLLLPTPPLTSPVGLAASPSAYTADTWTAPSDAAAVPEMPGHSPDAPAPSAVPADPSPHFPTPSTETPRAPLSVIRCLWLAGMAGAVLLLLWQNAALVLRLRRTHRRMETASCLPVYQSEAAPTPFLLGLLRPAVYLPAGDYAPEQLRHILAHEEAHYRHGDHLWAWVRGACQVLHWYNPLVWWGASLSRRDGEIFCDEAALRSLGEGEAAAYGQTLLSVAAPRRVVWPGLGGGKAGLGERLKLLVRRPRTVLAAAAVLVLAAACVGVMVFTSTNDPMAAVYGQYAVLTPPYQDHLDSIHALPGWTVAVTADRFSIQGSTPDAVELSAPLYTPIDYEQDAYYCTWDAPVQVWSIEGGEIPYHLLSAGDTLYLARQPGDYACIVWPLTPLSPDSRWPAYHMGEIEDLFSAASQAASWFGGGPLGQISYDPDQALTDQAGRTWRRVTEPHLSTMADLQAYLLHLFSPIWAGELLGRGVFAEFDGVLYVSYDLWSPWQAPYIRLTGTQDYPGEAGGNLLVHIDVLDLSEPPLDSRSPNVIVSMGTAYRYVPSALGEGYVFQTFSPWFDVQPSCIQEAQQLWSLWQAGEPVQLSLIRAWSYLSYCQGWTQEAQDALTAQLRQYAETAENLTAKDFALLLEVPDSLTLSADRRTYDGICPILWRRDPATTAYALHHLVREELRPTLQRMLCVVIGREQGRDTLSTDELNTVLAALLVGER